MAGTAGPETAPGADVARVFIPDDGAKATRAWLKSIKPGDGLGPDNNYMPSSHYDSYGHCVAGCSYAEAHGTTMSLMAGFAREMAREFTPLGGPHDSFIEDVHNEWVGAAVNDVGMSCAEGCDAAYRSGQLLLTAPTSRWFNLEAQDWVGRPLPY